MHLYVHLEQYFCILEVGHGTSHSQTVSIDLSPPLQQPEICKMCLLLLFSWTQLFNMFTHLPPVENSYIRCCLICLKFLGLVAGYPTTLLWSSLVHILRKCTKTDYEHFCHMLESTVKWTMTTFSHIPSNMLLTQAIQHQMKWQDHIWFAVNNL